jgi:hypothetical protein
LGHCPLMPEEGFLMLAALGFKRGTRIYLAGAHMYGGEAKMTILKYLYPNIVTKEDILTDEEIAPFRNYSSQVAYLRRVVTEWRYQPEGFSLMFLVFSISTLNSQTELWLRSNDFIFCFYAVSSTGLLGLRIGRCICHD